MMILTLRHVLTQQGRRLSPLESAGLLFLDREPATGQNRQSDIKLSRKNAKYARGGRARDRIEHEPGVAGACHRPVRFSEPSEAAIPSETFGGGVVTGKVLAGRASLECLDRGGRGGEGGGRDGDGDGGLDEMGGASHLVLYSTVL